MRLVFPLLLVFCLFFGSFQSEVQAAAKSDKPAKSKPYCTVKWQKFWPAFAEKPKIQSRYTLNPLHLVEKNGAFLASKLASRNALKYPLLPAKKTRVKKGLILKEEGIGHNLGRLTLYRKDDESSSIEFYFRIQNGCWQLYRIEDRMTVHAEKPSNAWLEELFPSVDYCVPGFHFSDKPLEMVTSFFAAKGYSHPLVPDESAVEFEIQTTFYGYPATGFLAYMPEESVYIVTVAVSAEKLAAAIKHRGRGKIAIHQKENPEGQSDLAYLVSRGPESTLFVCPVDIGF